MKPFRNRRAQAAPASTEPPLVAPWTPPADPWADWTITNRFGTVRDATVEQYDHPTRLGIAVWRCLGCGTRSGETTSESACNAANTHAETCRALPRTGANSIALHDPLAVLPAAGGTWDDEILMRTGFVRFRIARDPAGESVPLPYCNLLIGGGSNTGRTAAAQLAAIPSILDSRTRMVVVCGGNAATWAPIRSLTNLVGTGNTEQAGQQLEQILDGLATILAQREKETEDARKHFRNTPYYDTIHVVLDDASRLLDGATWPERVRDVVRSLVNASPAARILTTIVENNPAMLARDLHTSFKNRVCLPTNSSTESRNVLGATHIDYGADASRLSAGLRGVGVLVTPDRRAAPVGFDWISDADFARVCTIGRAKRLAAGVDVAPEPIAIG